MVRTGDMFLVCDPGGDSSGNGFLCIQKKDNDSTGTFSVRTDSISRDRICLYDIYQDNHSAPV